MGVEKVECEHKWLPNGMIAKGFYDKDVRLEPPVNRYREEVFASCICEKCGEIKIKHV